MACFLIGLGCASDRAKLDETVDARSGPDHRQAASDDGAGWDGPIFSGWPADGTVVIASGKDALGANLSGLVYEPASGEVPGLLWAVQNRPSKLYRLAPSGQGTVFVSTTGDGWTTGKLLHYPDGNGSPDAEGLTRTDWTSAEIYVVSERDSDVPDVSRPSILRYALAGSKGVVSATHEWTLTGEMSTDPNHGLEGIAWIPDTYLVERGFFDDSAGTSYDPARYPEHGDGLFLVGREDNGTLSAYALDHVAGTQVRIATFPSGQPRSVDLTFDRETGLLWSLCDQRCDGRMALLEIDVEPDSVTAGRFVLRAILAPPEALSSMQNEGIALAPLSECLARQRPFFWADDQASDGYAIRKGWMTCERPF